MRVLLVGVVGGGSVGAGVCWALRGPLEANLADYTRSGNPEWERTELHHDPSDGRIGQIRLFDPYGNTYDCTGALIGPQEVLSAGHCFTGWSSEDHIEMFLGAHRTASGALQLEDTCTLELVDFRDNERWGEDVAYLEVVECQSGIRDPGEFYGHYPLRAEKAQQGEMLRLQGYPGVETEGSLWLSQGEMLGHCWWLCNTRHYRASLRISGGSSGGVVLDDNDQIVGIVSSVGPFGDTFIQSISRRIHQEAQDITAE